MGLHLEEKAEIKDHRWRDGEKKGCDDSEDYGLTDGPKKSLPPRCSTESPISC